jgi:hypothetical protein
MRAEAWSPFSRWVILAILASVDVLPTSAAQGAFSSWVYPTADSRLLYRRDALGNRVPDFSRAGYRSGVAPIPDVPVRLALSPVSGDNTARIQQAIDAIATLPLDENGFRGAVLLRSGEYPVEGTIAISTSGIVLRGEENSASGTLLRATGKYKQTLIRVQGYPDPYLGPENVIADKYVPVGARSFTVFTTNELFVGANVRIFRPSPTNWIQDIRMWTNNMFHEYWPAGSKDVIYERTILRIEDHRLFLDAPITCALEEKYGGGTARRCDRGSVMEVGIEHLRADSDFEHDRDEDHGWIFITFMDAENCWVRNVASFHFGFACVQAMEGTRRLTVADAECWWPVSKVAGDRRYAFNLDDAQYSLVRNCYTRFDRHQFVTGSLTHGPNVFVDGLSEKAHSDAGPHHRWATGILWDNIHVASAGSTFGSLDTAELNIRNRGMLGSGHGWSGANCVAWNSYAVGGSVIDSPPTARNWSIGRFFELRSPYQWNPGGSGTIESPRTPVFPSSLYHAQLQDALDAPNLQLREYVVGDFDRFATSAGAGENVPIDPGWLQALQALGVYPVHGFDHLTGDHTVGWSHRFQLSPDDIILSATLSIALRATGGAPENDLIYLDSTATGQPLANYVKKISDNDSTVVVIDLANWLTQLADGSFNLAVRDDVAVDWSVLELRVTRDFPRTSYNLVAEADAYVRNGNSALTNFGSDGSLVVKEDSDADFDRCAFIRWDLRPVQGRVMHAKVRLVPVYVGQMNIENAASIALSDSWIEGGLTWENQPGADYRFASWVVRDSTPVEFNVTPQVLEALAHDRTLSVRIHSVRDFGDGGGVEYASREHSGRGIEPHLIITVTNSAPIIRGITNRAALVKANTEPIPFAMRDPGRGGDLSLQAGSHETAVVAKEDRIAIELDHPSRAGLPMMDLGSARSRVTLHWQEGDLVLETAVSLAPEAVWAPIDAGNRRIITMLQTNEVQFFRVRRKHPFGRGVRHQILTPSASETDDG